MQLFVSAALELWTAKVYGVGAEKKYKNIYIVNNKKVKLKLRLRQRLRLRLRLNSRIWLTVKSQRRSQSCCLLWAWFRFFLSSSVCSLSPSPYICFTRFSFAYVIRQRFVSAAEIQAEPNWSPSAGKCWLVGQRIWPIAWLALAIFIAGPSHLPTDNYRNAENTIAKSMQTRKLIGQAQLAMHLYELLANLERETCRFLLYKTIRLCLNLAKEVRMLFWWTIKSIQTGQDTKAGTIS